MLLKNNKTANQRRGCRLTSQLRRGFPAKRLANLELTLAGPKNTSIVILILFLNMFQV